MTDLQLLGRIARLQIQRAALKHGVKPDQVYDPAALLAVETLTLTPDGAEVWQPEGRLLDVHHAHHPETRHAGPNPLSLGFTGHYDLMRARFGGPVALGCAGENLVVELGRRVTLDELAGGVVVQAAGRPVRLERMQVAAPCLPFTRYLLRQPAESDTLKASLQYLDHGLRGFYASLAEAEPAVVAVGDLVFAVRG